MQCGSLPLFCSKKRAEMLIFPFPKFWTKRKLRSWRGRIGRGCERTLRLMLLLIYPLIQAITECCTQLAAGGEGSFAMVISRTVQEREKLTQTSTKFLTFTAR